MNEQLLAHLSSITEEENLILDGLKGIDRNLYTETNDFTIDSKKMLQSGKLITIRPHTRFVSFPKHKHNYIEIIYMCQGKLSHILGQSTSVTLKAGELLFLNQHSSHSIEKASKEDIAINFIILPEFFDIAFNMIDRESAIGNFLISTLCQDSGKEEYLHFKVADVLPIQNLVENMIWSLVHGQSNKRQINQFTMGLLLLQLLNHTDKLDHLHTGSYEKVMMMNVLRYIEENYKDATLTELSGLLHQPISKLSKLIKQQTGSTFKELLQQKRLTKSAQLLVQTSLAATEIIAAVGYDNTSYFYSIFKEKYGMSPREYRLGVNKDIV
jgi:AraC-like DNA-binding protein/mannose-6-phosphate isomerase-like protein (cupin superfamily)